MKTRLASSVLGVTLTIGAITLPVFVSVACSDSSESPPPATVDGGPPDGNQDSGVTDSGATDTGASDTGSDAAVATAPLQFVGRTDTRSPAGVRFAWPGTRILARFSGTGAKIRLHDTGKNRFDVSIDGAPPTVLSTASDNDNYTLASGLTDGPHDLVLVKRTEAFNGVVQLFEITSNEGRALIPIPAPTGRRIEFIGEDNLCGYGVLGIDSSCVYSVDTESEPDTYGALTALALNATHTTIAYTGVGLTRDYGGNTANTLPSRFARSLPDDATSTWAFTWIPDVVVVELGRTDFVMGDPGAAFRTAYVNFLATLRTHYPSAKIVATLSASFTAGPRLTAQGYIMGAVTDRNSAGDANVSYFELDEQLPADGYGCDFHPNTTTQGKGATKLTAALKTLLGW